jgi:hypothetical protein
MVPMTALPSASKIIGFLGSSTIFNRIRNVTVGDFLLKTMRKSWVKQFHIRNQYRYLFILFQLPGRNYARQLRWPHCACFEIIVKLCLVCLFLNSWVNSYRLSASFYFTAKPWVFSFLPKTIHLLMEIIFFLPEIDSTFVDSCIFHFYIWDDQLSRISRVPKVTSRSKVSILRPVFHRWISETLEIIIVLLSSII